MGKVVTTVDKAKFIGVEIFKEAVGTAGGFGGVWVGEKLGLSQDQSMLLGMTTSIVSSKGADWVDNNFDNLTLATKYTFNNYGKNVTLGCNGAGTFSEFCDTFTDIKNGKIDINQISNVETSKVDIGIVKDVKYGKHFTRVNRKKVLKSNVSYTTVEGYKYKTNELGVISEVEGVLKLGEGNRNPYAQRIVGGDYRLPDDEGGHLIATQFLGSGELDNLVPMNSQINRSGGKWYNMEQEWASALKEGKEVKVKIEPIYDGDNIRPISFKVKYNIDGQRPKIIKILNQAGG